MKAKKVGDRYVAYDGENGDERFLWLDPSNPERNASNLRYYRRLVAAYEAIEAQIELDNRVPLPTAAGSAIRVRYRLSNEVRVLVRTDPQSYGDLFLSWREPIHNASYASSDIDRIFTDIEILFDAGADNDEG